MAFQPPLPMSVCGVPVLMAPLPRSSASVLSEAVQAAAACHHHFCGSQHILSILAEMVQKT